VARSHVLLPRRSLLQAAEHPALAACTVDRACDQCRLLPCGDRGWACRGIGRAASRCAGLLRRCGELRDQPRRGWVGTRLAGPGRSGQRRNLRTRLPSSLLGHGTSPPWVMRFGPRRVTRDLNLRASGGSFVTPYQPSGWAAFRALRSRPAPMFRRRHGNFRHGRYCKRGIEDRRLLRSCMVSTDRAYGVAPAYCCIAERGIRKTRLKIAVPSLGFLRLSGERFTYTTNDCLGYGFGGP